MISLNRETTSQSTHPNGDNGPSDVRRPAAPLDHPSPHLVERLQHQIRSIETVSRQSGEDRVSSGCSAVDGLLPAGGYERGSLVQWLTGGGQGADYLSLLVAREACRDGGALVVFDPQNQFFPPAAAAIGLNLDHLIVLKDPRNNSRLSDDLLWSIDQSLRCPAVAAVWGPAGHLHERWFRRFQLSAETSGCLGLFVQPIQEARNPSWADVQWLVSNRHDETSDQTSAQQVRLQLTRCRGTRTGKSLHLSINTVTGNVQMARNQNGKFRRQLRQKQCDPQPGKTPGRWRDNHGMGQNPHPRTA